MTSKENIIDFVEDVTHGHKGHEKMFEVIGDAISFKARIPKKFWQESKSKFHLLEFFDCYDYPKKADLVTLRNTIAEELIERITDGTMYRGTPRQRQMYSDNYFRLLHALTLLRIAKTDPRIPKPKNNGENYQYYVAYNLWILDNGSNDSGMLDTTAWYASEASKQKQN